MREFLGDLQTKKKVFTPATHGFRVIFLVISKKKAFTPAPHGFCEFLSDLHKQKTGTFPPTGRDPGTWP